MSPPTCAAIALLVLLTLSQISSVSVGGAATAVTTAGQRAPKSSTLIQLNPTIAGQFGDDSSVNLESSQNLSPFSCRVAAPGTANATIPLSGSQPFGIVFDNQDKNIYVADTFSDKVDVINPSTNTVGSSISTGHRPKGLTYDSAIGEVFVVEQGDALNNIPARIFSLSRAQGVNLPSGAIPIEITYDQFNDRLYVSDRGLNQVHVIDPNLLSDVADISVGTHPWGLAIDQYNGYVFVANQGSNTVTVIKGVSKLPSSLITGASPTGIVFDPVYQYLFVSDSGDNTLARFNATGNDATKYFSLGTLTGVGVFSSPGAMAIDCTHNTLWMVQDGSNTVTEIGLCPGTVVIQRTVSIWGGATTGSQPNDITYDSSTDAIYIANGLSNTVTTIETDTLATPPGGGCPQGVVDYGLNGNQKYRYTTTQFESVTTINNLGMGASNVAKYKKMASLQLNVVDHGVPTSLANGIYWTQNVMSVASAGAKLPFNKTSTTCASPLCIQFTSEIFNFTQSGAGITYKEGGASVLKWKCDNSGVAGKVTKDPATYLCDTQWEQGLTLPLTVKLLVITGTETSGKFIDQPFISFQYRLSTGIHANKWIEYDRLHFNNFLTGVRITGNPLFTVSAALAPDGHFNDAEIVFCGFAGSASVAFTSMQATMSLMDLNSTAGGFTFVPHAFASGSDTGESTSNVFIKATSSGGTAVLGGDNTGQLY